MINQSSPLLTRINHRMNHPYRYWYNLNMFSMFFPHELVLTNAPHPTWSDLVQLRAPARSNSPVASTPRLLSMQCAGPGNGNGWWHPLKMDITWGDQRNMGIRYANQQSDWSPDCKEITCSNHQSNCSLISRKDYFKLPNSARLTPEALVRRSARVFFWFVGIMNPEEPWDFQHLWWPTSMTDDGYQINDGYWWLLTVNDG